MRSVILIFEDDKQDAIIRFFDSYCNESFGEWPEKQWNVLVNDDACLYINPIFEYEDDFIPFIEDIEDEDSLKILKEIDNNVVLWGIDISGRHDGRKEVTELIIQLFSVESGYAIDDYTDHFWTMEEIQNKKLIKGHAFFDFKGCYLEEKHTDFYDALLVLTDPYARKALTNKYPSRSYGLWNAEILEVHRKTGGYSNYDFTIKVKYDTYTGAHNPLEGPVTLTFDVKLEGVTVTKVEG
ncbi:DUF3888 domain-containing protein [Neobacillus bataviensis]|uniref:DUF3888 domain-containing protein n=1 Tax=Neobacillus bataviensis TaxID=220685 RepID=UPI001CBB97DD|nr:DUF3888 domain-containing protein [Neobacillus bataviensis]